MVLETWAQKLTKPESDIVASSAEISSDLEMNLSGVLPSQKQKYSSSIAGMF